MNKKIILFVLWIFLISGIFAAGTQTPSINLNYEINPSTYSTFGSDSIILSLTTNNYPLCKYSTQNINYTSMTNNFDGDFFETTHIKTFSGLSDGSYSYYIKCANESGIANESKIFVFNFVVSLPVSANISINDDPPLKAGKYEVNLITSKLLLGNPTLSYSFDGSVYKPIVLVGSNFNWKGYLIIPESVGEVVGSFKFSGQGLEDGKSEEREIKENKLFLVDTIKPKTISNIEAEGRQGQIRVSWFSENDEYRYNVYRSKDPNLDQNDFYKTVSEKNLIDNNVIKGNTYYYRVSAVDEAGNVGEMSQEIFATVLINNVSAKQGGLDLKLVGKVDNLITEINLINREIGLIKESMDTTNKEDYLFIKLGLGEELSRSESELNSLKKDVENYKLQDLTETELDNKLNSARLKIDVIKKKIPEKISLIDEKNEEKIISEDSINIAILEYRPELTEKENSQSVKDTLNFLDKEEIRIYQNSYIGDILYLDGTKKRITAIQNKIEGNSTSENPLIIKIPKDVAEKSSELNFVVSGYKIIKDDPVIKYDGDKKEIWYFLNKEISLDKISEIEIIPLKIYEEKDNSKITGNVIGNVSFENPTKGIIILGIIFLVLAIYLIFIKKSKRKKNLEEFYKKSKEVEEFYHKGDIEGAKKKYEEVKNIYKTLGDKDKIIAYNKLNNQVKK